MRNLILLSLLFLASSLSANPPASRSQDPLHADMETLRQREQLAGLVWGWFKGPASGVGASGFADLRSRRPMTPEARVQVGSVAKTVTALAVLRLVSLGQLDLNAPVATLLPELRLHNPWAQCHALRLRHLLDMSGGLRDLRLHHAFSRRHRADAPLAQALGDDPELMQLRSPPGQQFSYSNLSFLLLGMVIERRTGQAYAAWTDRELLRPLGMLDSSTALASDPPGAAVPAQGHLEDQSTVPLQSFGMRPSGTLLTTAADLIKLLRFIASDGKLQGQPFIDTRLLRAMGRPQGSDAARAGLTSGYGLGLFTRDRHGAVGLCHGGSMAGWRAMACLFPGDSPEAARGFAVVHNMDHESAHYAAFDARLVQELGLQRPPPPPRALTPAQRADAAWSGLYIADPPRLDLLDLPGRLFGVWSLRIDAHGARLREGLASVRQLSPEGAGRYRQTDRLQPTLALLRDAQGRPRLASGMLSLRQISVTEWGATWALVAAGLAGLLFSLLALPWRSHRQGRRATQPTSVAVGLLLACAAWATFMPWQELAQASAANLALCASSLLLPAAAAWQLALALQARRAGAAWRLEASAALAVLALCATLARFGLLPIALWRW